MSEDLVEELGELVDQVQALMDQAEQVNTSNFTHSINTA
jgi:hypothetical protein